MQSHSMLFTREGVIPPAFRAIIFDLDGTLCDTLADIAAMGNYALGHYGLPERPLDDYRYLAGQGARWLLEQAFGPEHQEKIDEALVLFKAHQLKHGMDLSKPFEGMPELLNAIKDKGHKLAVLSNKPHAATVDMIGAKFAAWDFDLVMGHKEEFKLKPDPGSALWMCEQLAVKPEEVLYVGDTAVDMQTASNAGFFAAGVLWGFRNRDELMENGAKVIASHPEQLIELL